MDVDIDNPACVPSGGIPSRSMEGTEADLAIKAAHIVQKRENNKID